MTHGARTTRGFTLIETLVAVSVVALLVGVLLPAVGSARASAREAACAAHVRELSAANALRALDHEGECAPGAVRIAEENLRRWHGSREHTGQAFDAAGGELTPYLSGAASSDSVRRCPSFAGTLDELRERGGGFERSAGGYAYNNAFVGVKRVKRGGVWRLDTTERGSKRDRFRSPARTAEFADGAFAGDPGLIEYSFLEPPRWPESPQWAPDPSTHFRHKGAANVAWLDGHVSAERRSGTAWSGLYPTDPEPLGIGWFGPLETNELFDYE